MRFRFHKLFHRLSGFFLSHANPSSYSTYRARPTVFPVSSSARFALRVECRKLRSWDGLSGILVSGEGTSSLVQLSLSTTTALSVWGILWNSAPPQSSLFSREAATYCSPARKRWVKAKAQNQPRRAARNRALFPIHLPGFPKIMGRLSPAFPTSDSIRFGGSSGRARVHSCR